METIKTAVVVVLLLAVLYGVYVVLNKPELSPPPEIAWQKQPAEPPQVEFGTAGDQATELTPGSFTATAAPLETPRAPSTSATAVDATAGGSAYASSYPSANLTDDNDLADAEIPPTFAIPSSPQLMTPVTERAAGDRAASPQGTKTAGSDEFDGSQYDFASTSVESQSTSIYANPDNFREQSPATSAGGGTFDAAWEAAIAQLEKQQWGDALFTLSVFYSDSAVTGEQRQRLIDLLDPLAGKVIYSQEHALAPAHHVQAGETLDQIAKRYQVPAELLASINGINDPNRLTPGAELKVVRGPFRAEVDLAHSELVLFVGEHYAGRFPVSVGNDPVPQSGAYQVQDKQAGRYYVDPASRQIPPQSPENPYGSWWIDLGQNMSLHGSPETMPNHGGLGCISLTDDDAADVFTILSAGSPVTIR